jgi:hypothetical protein
METDIFQNAGLPQGQFVQLSTNIKKSSENQKGHEIWINSKQALLILVTGGKYYHRKHTKNRIKKHP